MTIWHQCHLMETKPQPADQLIAWIDKGAEVGKIVEIPSMDGRLFQVLAVYGSMNEEQLKAKQKADRGFGGSIR